MACRVPLAERLVAYFLYFKIQSKKIERRCYAVKVLCGAQLIVGSMVYFSEVVSSTVQGAQNSLATVALKTIAQGEFSILLLYVSNVVITDLS